MQLVYQRLNYKLEDKYSICEGEDIGKLSLLTAFLGNIRELCIRVKNSTQHKVQLFN